MTPIGCALFLSYDDYGPAGEAGGGGNGGSSASSSSSGASSSSSSSSSSSGNVKNCENGLLDPGEQGIDCGGVCPIACPDCGAVGAAFVAAPVVPIGHGADLIKAVDYNLDSIPDIVLVSASSITTLMGVGNGTFSSMNEGAYSSLGMFTIGTFDPIESPDLVVTQAQSLSLGISLNAGFAKGDALTPVVVGAAANAVVSGDFDGDGNADLAWTASGSNVLSFLIGSGSGAFTPSLALTFAMSAKPSSMLVTDLDKNGVPEVVIADKENDRIYVVVISPPSTFAIFPHQVGAAPGQMIAGDFDGDGKGDLAVTSNGSGSVSLVFDALASTPTIGGLIINDVASMFLGTADFNGDNRPDLAVSSSDGSIQIFLGSMDGDFANGPSLSMPPGTVAIDTVDANGDGKMDIVAVSNNGDFVKVFLNQCVF